MCVCVCVCLCVFDLLTVEVKHICIEVLVIAMLYTKLSSDICFSDVTRFCCVALHIIFSMVTFHFDTCCCCCWSGLTSGSQKWVVFLTHGVSHLFILSSYLNTQMLFELKKVNNIICVF